MMKIPEREQNNEKRLLVLRTIVFESGRKNSQNSEKDVFIGSHML